MYPAGNIKTGLAECLASSRLGRVVRIMGSCLQISDLSSAAYWALMLGKMLHESHFLLLENRKIINSCLREWMRDVSRWQMKKA